MNGETPAERPVPAIDGAVLDELWAHAESGHPEEVCGLLLGPRGAIDEVRRCENIQNALHDEDAVRFPRDARTAYFLGGKDLFFLQRSLRGDRPTQIIYHSHVDKAAYFSEEDVAAAVSEGELVYPVDYLVIDAQRDGARAAKLFRFQGGAFVEIAHYDRRKI